MIHLREETKPTVNLDGQDLDFAVKSIERYANRYGIDPAKYVKNILPIYEVTQGSNFFENQSVADQFISNHMADIQDSVTKTGRYNEFSAAKIMNNDFLINNLGNIATYNGTNTKPDKGGKPRYENQGFTFDSLKGLGSTTLDSTMTSAQTWTNLLSQFKLRPVLIPIYLLLFFMALFTLYNLVKKPPNIVGDVIKGTGIKELSSASVKGFGTGFKFLKDQFKKI